MPETDVVAIRILHEVRCIQLYEKCAALLRDLDHALKELQDKVMSSHTFRVGLVVCVLRNDDNFVMLWNPPRLQNFE